MSVQATEAGVGIVPPAPVDYRNRITAIRDSLGGPQVEMIGRFLLPGLGVTLISILTEDSMVALLYLLFLLTQAMLFGFLATRKAVCSRADYVMALVLAGLTSTALAPSS